jgi:hypothetical protein
VAIGRRASGRRRFFPSPNPEHAAMTERKPPGQPWETWIERQIRERMERGEFDDLPGAGKPFADLGAANDDAWWIKAKLRREGISLLPQTLAARAEVARMRERLPAAADEAEVRRLVAAINARIAAANAAAVSGPPTALTPLDPEREVERWRRGG